MGLLRRIAADAYELARALTANGDRARPTVKDAVRASVAQDGYKVLLMSRVRESARRWHVRGSTMRSVS